MLDKILMGLTILLIPVELFLKNSAVPLILLFLMLCLGAYSVLSGRSFVYLLKILLFFKVYVEIYIRNLSYSNYIYSVIFLFLLILYAIYNIEKINLKRLKNNWYILVAYCFFLIFCVFTMLFGSHMVPISFGKQFSEFIRYFTIFTLLFMILSYFEPIIGLEKFILKTIVQLSVLPMFLGVLHFVLKKDLVFSAERNAFRVASIFAHPNTCGFFCVIIVSQILLYLKFKDRWYLHAYLGVVVFVLFVGTQTRNAMIVSLALIVYGWAVTWKRRMLIALGAVYVLIFMQSYWLPLIETVDSTDITKSSTALRDYVVQKVSENYPLRMYTGYGLGNMPVLVMNSVGGEELKAHNDYLKLSYEVGLLGTIFYCLIFLLALFKIAANCITTRNKYIGFSGKLCIVLILLLYLMMRYDNIVEQMILQYYLWSIIGVTIVLSSDKSINNTVYVENMKVQLPIPDSAEDANENSIS